MNSDRVNICAIVPLRQLAQRLCDVAACLLYKLCENRHNMPSPLSLSGRRSASRRRADRNVAVGSHSQYVPTLTAAAAWRLNVAVSKAAW